MYCKYCGKQLADEAIACTACGRPTDNYKRMRAAAPVRTTPAQTVQPAQPAPAEKRTNNFAIAGFVVSLLGLWLGALFCIAPAVGLVLSSLALKNSKRCNSCNGLGIAGLVLAICGIVIWLFLWMDLLLTCTIPGY